MTTEMEEVRAATPVDMLVERITEMARSQVATESHEFLEKVIRVAAEQMATDQRARGVAASKARCDAFILAVASGLPVITAASLAGVPRRTLYDLRERDEEFARRWDDALEQSLSNVETRLEEIALTGPATSMATVRAAEALLRIRYRPVAPKTKSVARFTRKDGDKTVILEWKSNTPQPD
jgi:hypothetical protein